MDKILMTPGPTNIPDDIFKAMSFNIHHRTDRFAEIMENVSGKLGGLFGSKNEVIMLLSSGTGGLEAAITNVFSPGDKLLVVNCGVFGKRFGDIARLYGVDVYEKTVEWGFGIKEYELEEELVKREYKAVYVTYSETSTGVKNDIKALGSIVKKYNSLFIVDIVSALGCLEFNADAFNVDVAIAGSQKGLMCPPGLSLISISDRAWDAIEKSTMPRFYFDLRKYKNSGLPYTPGISLILGVDKALDMISKEGIENILNRHKKYSRTVKHVCSIMGLIEFPDKNFNSEVLTAVHVPDGMDAKTIINKMYEKGVVIAGGQGKLKGKIIRLGHMGYMTDDYIITAVECLSSTLNELGCPNDTQNILRETKIALEG